MRELINKIDKKPVIITILMIIFQTFTFFIAKLFQSSPHVIGNIIDTKIPFVSYFIVPYYMWFFMVLLIPCYYYKRDKKLFLQYVLCYLMAVIISSLIFLFYPSIVVRPDIKITNIFTFLTYIIYFIDTPAINCFPSMHCAISMLFILTITSSKHTNLRNKIIVIISSILIMISTLYTKQHVFVDLVCGDIMMCFIYITFKDNKLLLNKLKKLLKM